MVVNVVSYVYKKCLWDYSGANSPFPFQKEAKRYPPPNNRNSERCSMEKNRGSAGETERC